MSLVPNHYQINNDRKKFPTKSLHKIEKTQLIDLLKKSILMNKTKLSNIYVAEMVCSGYYREIWDLFFTIWVNYVQLKNLRLLSWLLEKYHYYKKIQSDNRGNQPNLKNLQEIRDNFSQVCTILSIAAKTRIQINSKQQNFELSENTREIANYYWSISRKQQDENIPLENESQFILALAQFIEAYNQHKIKAVYFWLRQFFLFTYKIKPIYTKFFKATKKTADHCIWLVWYFIYHLAKKKVPDGLIYRIITDLKELFLHFLGANNYEISLNYLYIAICYLQCFNRLSSLGNIDVINRKVIKRVMSVNLIYSNLEVLIQKYYYGNDPDQVERELEQQEAILIKNADKPRDKPIVIDTGDGYNVTKFTVKIDKNK